MNLDRFDDDPLSLPDLRDLIRETAETLDTLAEHVVLMRHNAEPCAVPNFSLELIEDQLRQAWTRTMRALRDATDLAALS